MGNQASCCTQNKVNFYLAFHSNLLRNLSLLNFTLTRLLLDQTANVILSYYNSPKITLVPGFTTHQNSSTDPTSGLRKQIFTDYSVARTQQDFTDNNTQVSPKKKKKLVRKKPPPLTDLGSLQDCCQTGQEHMAYQTSDNYENGN